jgi:uncharacterized repeat protein (TIGR04138 family)
MESRKSIEQIAGEDGRFRPDAIQFVYEGLGFTVRKSAEEKTFEEEEKRHVSGGELSVGLGELAKDKWGRLAKVVLNGWGIFTTRDFGEIVYLMIDNKWMSANPEDHIEDFDDIFDFEQFFEKDYKLEIIEKNPK